MNGKKITNLANPTGPQDAATKSYADAVRAFTTGIVIAGADANGLVSFTSATGYTGLSFTNSDTAWVSRVAGTPVNMPNRLALNDKADATGKDVFFISDLGQATTLSGGFGNNTFYDGTSWRAVEAGYVNLLSLDKSSGLFTYYSNTTAAVAGAVVPLAQGFSCDKDGNFTATGVITSAAGITATGAITSTSGQFAGSQPNTILGAAGGAVFLRPNGVASSAGQAYVATDGSLTLNGSLSTPNSNVTAATFYSVTGNYVGNTGGGVVLAPNGGGTVYLRPNGVGSASGQFTVAGNGDVAQPNGAYNMNGPFTTNGTITTGINGFKPGGGSWATLSDERIKTVSGDYETGLEAILALHPVRYTFKGNDTPEPPSNLMHGEVPPEGAEEDKTPPTVPYRNSIHYPVAVAGTVYTGLIAQEVEAVLPEMVSNANAYIDGAAVTDLRMLDTSSLIFALVNAVKELSAKVEALEAKA